MQAKTSTSTTYKSRVGCGNLYSTVVDSGTEVFVHLGKSGGCVYALSEALGRMVALAIRSGADREEIVRELLGVRCPSPVSLAHSCPDALGRVLANHFKVDVPTANNKQVSHIAVGNNGDRVAALQGISPECPECGAMLVPQEGCAKCPSCGYAACG